MFSEKIDNRLFNFPLKYLGRIGSVDQYFVVKMSLHVVVLIFVHLAPEGNHSGGDLQPSTQGNKQTNTYQSCQQ